MTKYIFNNKKKKKTMARFVRLGNDIVTRKNLGDVYVITMIDNSVYYASHYEYGVMMEIDAPNGVKYMLNHTLIKSIQLTRVIKGTTSSDWEVFYIMDVNTKVKVNGADNTIPVADSISGNDVKKFFV